MHFREIIKGEQCSVPARSGQSNPDSKCFDAGFVINSSDSQCFSGKGDCLLRIHKLHRWFPRRTDTYCESSIILTSSLEISAIIQCRYFSHFSFLLWFRLPFKFILLHLKWNSWNIRTLRQTKINFELHRSTKLRCMEVATNGA